MKRECDIVRDLLPLYLEDMVSGGTGDFVREHLAECPGCAAQWETMKTDGDARSDAQERKAEAKGLIQVKKKLRKKRFNAVTITAVCLLAIVGLLHLFPVYRLAQISWAVDYYDRQEIEMLLYIGSAGDRAEAQAVLRQADAAFRDCAHTSAENEEAYGLLSRYATDTDYYSNAAFATHSLELWSAHLGESEGYLWVFYSNEVYDSEGDVLRGGWNIPSLWRVEKNDAGEWVVVKIKEHP